MSADVIYYNLTIGDNDFNSAGNMDYTTVPAVIDAFNTIPILTNPDEYYGAIIRFQIPAQNVPLMPFIIQTPVGPNPTDINKGIYSFTITQGSPTSPPTLTSGQSFVFFEPQVILPPAQIPPVNTPTQATSAYYLLYDYTRFLNMWNTALQTASAAIGLATSPFFVYDAPTQLISLYVNKTDFAGYNLWFNNQFLTFMLGLESVSYNQAKTSVAGLDNLVVIRDTLVNTVTLGGIAYLQTSFQYGSYGYWNFLKSFLITTTMNVASEVVYSNNNSTSIVASGSNMVYINILEDFMPDLAMANGAGVQNQIFTYVAPSLYRIFSFNQKSPLYKVNLAIVLADIYGNQYPLTLPKGQLANFKLMFIKKTLYAGINKSV